MTFAETLFQDVRFGLRTFRKSPGFVSVGVLTLTLGVGANTAIFCVANSVLPRPLSYSDAATTFFDQIGPFGGTTGANLTGCEPIRVTVTNVTTSFFSMLGVQPIVGRAFSADEGKPEQPPQFRLPR